MNLFDVYPLFDLEPVKGKGSYIKDSKGYSYLDFYGGHAVISIGHSHPVYVKKISDQLHKIGFYSNAIINPLQSQLAEKLGNLSGCDDHNLFLCNSGAEAIENALKTASFYNGKKKIIAFHNAFHGRTSAAVSVSDNPKISAEINKGHEVILTPLNDIDSFKKIVNENDDICAVIIEGIQGIGGIRLPDIDFLHEIEKTCKQNKIVLILDEVQSGYGRSGKFFAFQYSGIKPDIITTAKGMGNGFPVGGVLINKKINASYGMLGTTYGGNYLACSASIAVLEVIEKENLIENAARMGDYIMNELKKLSKVKEIRGKGLMIGVEFDTSIKEFRKSLLFEHKIITGISGEKIIRLLPPLNINLHESTKFLEGFNKALNKF